ncbi:hypothetical protein GCM10028895_46350 [Pontibacter rugosus]
MRFYTSVLYCIIISFFPLSALAQTGSGQQGIADAAAYKTIDSLNTLAFKIKRNDVDHALTLLHKAASMSIKLEYKKGESVSYLNEAGIFQQNGYTEKAIALYYKSLGISQEIKDTLNVARASQQIGNALVEGGDLKGAEKLLKKL